MLKIHDFKKGHSIYKDDNEIELFSLLESIENFFNKKSYKEVYQM